MRMEEVEPLWQSVVGDREPWRRGRLALVLVAILTAVLQASTLTLLLMGGLIEALAINASLAAIFWLQFYFIWIGVNWIRWLQGSVSLLTGFAMLIWGFGGGSGPLLVIGTYSMIVGGYIGFAPSVHFFAARQRERRDWPYNLAVGFVFLLLIGSLLAGGFGLSRYRTEMQEQARAFADLAFARIFTDHDTRFLLDYATPRILAPPFGVGYLTHFLSVATMQAQEVRQLQPARGQVRLRYRFPITFFVEGEMRTEGYSDPGPGRVVMRMALGGVPGSWQIDQLTWMAPDKTEAPAHQR